MRRFAVATAAIAAAVAAAALAAPRSGSSYLAPDLKALQEDDFRNPGLLWVEQGRRLWSTPPSAAAKACAGCHDEAAMRGVAAHYPAYDKGARRVVNLEQRINLCRTGRQHAPALAYESRDLIALTAFVSRQSLGMPVAVRVDGPAAASFARGRAAYHQRIGQLDLSCADCHERSEGRRLHGETISQGQINGFPTYRQLWEGAASTHRMFAWCNAAVRAEPRPAGSQDYVDLELYVRWRGQGLTVETPAVRK